MIVAVTGYKGCNKNRYHATQQDIALHKNNRMYCLDCIVLNACCAFHDIPSLSWIIASIFPEVIAEAIQYMLHSTRKCQKLFPIKYMENAIKYRHIQIIKFFFLPILSAHAPEGISKIACTTHQKTLRNIA